MTTVRDLITDALEDIGAIAAGEAVDAVNAASCLRVLNRLLGSWAEEELMCYTVDRTTFNLVANQQSYTLGVGGTFNTTYPVRPAQINLASVIYNGVELPIETMNDEQWQGIVKKDTYSTIPLMVWTNGNYPLNVLYFWPIPTVANQLVLSVWNQTTAYASVNDTVTLPPGYETALVSNLAVLLAPKFGLEASPTIQKLAVMSKQRIKDLNWEVTYRTVDSFLSGSHNNIGQRSRGYVID